MFDVFRNAFKIPDLRKKLLYTLMIIIIFRIGAAMPVPFIDPAALDSYFKTLTESGTSGNLLNYLDALTGGALSNATLFAMSITPYINASIIINLLTVALPPLERLSKEGEEGRRKLTKITRYLTIGLALAQAIMYYIMLKNQGIVVASTGITTWFYAIAIVGALTAGASLTMWLGEQINEKGIGNGISIILFAGIISRATVAIQSLVDLWKQGLGDNGDPKYFVYVPLIVVLFVAIVIAIVIMNNAERRIPVAYAKRVVGRKMYGGQSSHIPVKVSMSGVMPIIFASSLISIPGTIGAFVKPESKFWSTFLSWFNYTHWVYATLYFLLIIAFNYFYVAIQYNPIEIANNLRKNNGAVPGIRPGKPTADFIMKVISRITLVGALFLGVIAVFPILFSNLTHTNISLGGTSIIIIVGVAQETVRILESQMMMRHHKGFLE